MELSSKRLGILGGSFNPIHLAHLLLAQEAWYRLDLTKVMFVPAAKNPLKEDPKEITTDAHRLNMLKLAIEDDIRFELDQWEIRNGGVSYTVELLKRYKQKYADWDLYLLMGADSAFSLPKWKDINQYSELCRIVFCNRPGEHDLSDRLPDELLKLNLNYEFMPLPPLDLSSTEIRRRIRLGKPVRYFVPDAVAEYIAKRQVYNSEK